MKFELNKKAHYKRFLAIGILIILLFCSCSKEENKRSEERKLMDDSKKIESFIEANYGIADNPVYGQGIVETRTSDTVLNSTYTEKFLENSRGGAIFYSQVIPDGKTNGLVCVYLSDQDNNRISLNAEYIYDYNLLASGSHILTLATPTMKSCVYVIVGDKYIASITKSEWRDSLVSQDDYIFEEKISFYSLSGKSLEEKYTISRTLKSGNIGLKDYQIKSDSEWTIFTEGFGNYVANGAKFLSTEKEFCEKANNLLYDCSLECVTLHETSWEERWNGISINENRINDDFVKVDFSSSDPIVDESGKEISDIVININDEL